MIAPDCRAGLACTGPAVDISTNGGLSTVSGEGDIGLESIFMSSRTKHARNDCSGKSNGRGRSGYAIATDRRDRSIRSVGSTWSRSECSVGTSSDY
jgi:hypothetical protein